MSKDDSSTGQPIHGDHEETKPSPALSKKDPLPLVSLKDEETDVSSLKHSHGLRILAWLVAIVALLTILGWAIGSAT